jgi:hypothetical protein
MARYLITEVSFIDGALVQPGTEIESEATPGAAWELLEPTEPVEPVEPVQTTEPVEPVKKAR